MSGCLNHSKGKIIIIIFLFFRPTSTKPQAEILKLNNVNGCNDISFGDHSILEGDRIPPLKSHGQALELGRGTLFPWCPQ